MQILFKGVLNAGLADLGIARVAELGVFFILRVVHKADVAENVRSVGGVIASHERFLDIDTKHIVFTDYAYKLHIRVLHEYIVRGVYEVTDIDRIAYACNYPRLLGGVIAVYLIAAAHARQDLNGRCVLVDLVRLHIRLKTCLIGVGNIGEFKWRLGGYRQLVYIVLAVLANELNEL